MRTLTTLAAAAAVALPTAASLLIVPAAFAAAPGDNGTVKIHDVKTDEELTKNEPHVCEFYLAAFTFDPQQNVTWKIQTQAPTKPKDVVVEKGAFELDGNGNGRTDDLALPDGHYKLIWNFDGENGKAKHKVFWIDCEDGDDGGPSAPPSGDPSGDPSSEPSGEPSGEPSTDHSGEPSGEPSADPSDDASTTAPAPSPTPQGGSGDLAETGSSAPVGLLVTGAAVLLGAGAVLTRRRLGNRG